MIRLFPRLEKGQLAEIKFIKIMALKLTQWTRHCNGGELCRP